MAAPPLSNSFEGGSDGTTITTGNSGGASGDAFNNVTIGASCTCVFKNNPAGAGLTGQMTMPATAAATHVDWTGMGSLTSAVFFRMYLRKSGTPATTWFWPLEGLNNAAARCFGLAIRTNDVIRIDDASGTEVVALRGTQAIPNNQWVRIEAKVVPSTTVGTVEWRLYLSADSTTISETLNAGSLVLGANLDQVMFGNISSPTGMNNLNWHYDNLAVSTVDWLGPAVVAGTSRPAPRLRIPRLSMFRKPGTPAFLGFPQPSIDLAPSGVVYAKAGDLTAGTVFSGDGQAEYSETGSLTAGTVPSGADVAEHAETGSLTTRALDSGDGIHEAVEAGSLTAGTSLSGADVFNPNETGTTPVGTLLSGVSQYIPAGPVTYTKTGSLTAGTLVSGADSFQPVEAGSLTTRALVSGADVFTAAETGTTPVGTILSGVSVKISSGVYVKTGSLVAGTLLTGIDATTHTETGSLVSSAFPSGVQQYIPFVVPAVAGSVTVTDQTGTQAAVTDSAGASVSVADTTGAAVTVIDQEGAQAAVQEGSGASVTVVDVVP